jgi:hypothetical protein
MDNQMIDDKPLSQWMAEWGYRWTGPEQLIKGRLSRSDAAALLARMRAEGAVVCEQ